MEEKLTGNPKPSGNISDYNSIEEKEEMCKDMAGYNESLTVNYQQDKIRTIGEKKIDVQKENDGWWTYVCKRWYIYGQKETNEKI